MAVNFTQNFVTYRELYLFKNFYIRSLLPRIGRSSKMASRLRLLPNTNKRLYIILLQYDEQLHWKQVFPDCFHLCRDLHLDTQYNTRHLTSAYLVSFTMPIAGVQHLLHTRPAVATHPHSICCTLQSFLRCNAKGYFSMSNQCFAG